MAAAFNKQALVTKFSPLFVNMSSKYHKAQRINRQSIKRNGGTGGGKTCPSSKPRR
jgi:hypothetical protein